VHGRLRRDQRRPAARVAMSNIHVLGQSGKDTYTVVVHVAVPAGNNSAGVSWQTAVVNAGRNVTQMVAGSGAGQITPAEAAQVASGAVLEGSFQWGDDPTWTNQQRLDDLTLRASQLQAELLAQTAAALKFYGFTR